MPSTHPYILHSLDEQRLKRVSEEIDGHSARLKEISITIHENPEVIYNEYIASNTLVDFIQAQPGWTVKKGIYGLETAFLAQWDSGMKGAVISINAEYGECSLFVG
jgi:metal-dependent amidase/aminoacylase/carboxypeptidase family protein